MIWKKVTRFIIPCMIALLCVFSSIPAAKADTIQAHGTVSTSYGSYTWSAQQASSTLPIQVTLPFVGISFPYNSGTSFSLDYTFKNTYSGVMSITVTANNTWSVDNVNILTTGCNLDSIPSDHASYKTSHTFNIRVKQADNFSFVIYGAGTTIFLGSTSVSISHNISVDNKPAEIDQTLDLYLPGMSTSLSGLGYDSDTSTSLNADTLAYDISIIKNYIDGIESYLYNNNSYIDQIETYLNQLININKIGTYPLWQQNFLFWANNYGGLKFDSNLPYFNYYVSNNRGAFYNPYRLKAANGKTLSLIFYSNANINTSNITMYGANASNLQLTGGVSYYVPNYPLYLYRFDFKNNYVGSNFFTIEFDRDMIIYPIYLGGNDLIPDEVHTLLGTDYNNTYTRLLQQIVNGIGNISQEQIIENNTNINNYNDYQTSINNVENNYYTEYNNQSTVIENNNTFDFSGLDTTGVTAFNDLFTNIYNIPLVKYPILITLLGLVIVIILG